MTENQYGQNPDAPLGVTDNRSADLGRWIIGIALSAIPGILMSANEGFLGFLGIVLLGIPLVLAIEAGKKLKTKYSEWGTATFRKSTALWIYTRLVLIYGVAQYAAVIGGITEEITVLRIAGFLTIAGGIVLGAVFMRPESTPKTDNL